MKRFAWMLACLIALTPLPHAAAYEYALDLSLTLGEEYNDNINLEQDRVSDFITRISPGIDFALRSPTSELKLAYAPSFNIYSSHDEENNTSHRFSGKGVFALSDAITLTIDDSFVLSSELTDITTVADTGPIRRRAERTFHTLSSGLAHKLSGTLTGLLGVGFSDSDTDEPDEDRVKTYYGTAGLQYAAGQRTSFTGGARYAKYDYSRSSDAESLDFTLGVNHKVTPTFTANLTGGIIFTKIQDTGKKDTGFIGGATLTKTFERGSATLAYLSSVVPSTDNGEIVQNHTASFRFAKDLSERWKTSLSAYYIKSKSVESNALRETDTETIRLGADVSYALASWASLALSYYYTDFDDRVIDAEDYYNHIVLLSLKLTYGRRL